MPSCLLCSALGANLPKTFRPYTRSRAARSLLNERFKRRRHAKTLGRTIYGNTSSTTGVPRRLNRATQVERTRQTDPQVLRWMGLEEEARRMQVQLASCDGTRGQCTRNAARDGLA
jgi:hypothetical protein